MLERDQRMIDDGLVKNKYAIKTTSYALTIRDRIASFATTTATLTVSLPSVSEAEGKTFTIFATSASVTYPVTVQDLDDSLGWGEQGGDITLTSPNDYVTLYSDGMRWAILGTSIILDARKFVENFEVQPIASQNDGTIVSGTAGETNVMKLAGHSLEYNIKGTQTIVLPQLAAGGLDVGMDQTADDGVEITTGITARAPGAFVIGTDAFYAKLQFSIATVAGTDDCAFGFRLAEAYQGGIDSYNDMAMLNVIAGAIKIETILNGGGTTTTDTTDAWADAETHELEIRVTNAGVVTYLIDGAAPTVTAAFTFDDGDVVLPCFFFLSHTGGAGAVLLKHFEYGLM